MSGVEQPEPAATPASPGTPEALLWLSLGIIGASWPLVLVVGDARFFGEPWFRDSLSAYYHSDMRLWFVGVLCAMSAALLLWTDPQWPAAARRRARAAGMFGVLVAVFPTFAKGDTPEATLQRLLTENVVAVVHFSCAALFVLFLGRICWAAAPGNDVRPVLVQRWQAADLRWLHRGCALAIWVSAVAVTVLICLDRLGDLGWGRSYSVLVGEAVAVYAFSVSCLCRAVGLHSLRRRSGAASSSGTAEGSILQPAEPLRLPQAAKVNSGLSVGGGVGVLRRREAARTAMPRSVSVPAWSRPSPGAYPGEL